MVFFCYRRRHCCTVEKNWLKMNDWTIWNAHTCKLDSVACAIWMTAQIAVQIFGRRSCAGQFVQYRQYPPYTLHSYLCKLNCAGHIVQYYCQCVWGLTHYTVINANQTVQVILCNFIASVYGPHMNNISPLRAGVIAVGTTAKSRLCPRLLNCTCTLTLQGEYTRALTYINSYSHNLEM